MGATIPFALIAAIVVALAGCRASSPLSDQGVPPATGPQMRSVRCGDHDYDYILSAPPGRGSMPALVLLHGAGGQASDLADQWRAMAAAEGVTLIAPQLPRELWFEAEAPSVFRCVVADAREHTAIDTARVYLFGYSMGGYLAFDAAMFASDVFAAVAEYAAAIAPDYESIVSQATRKIPIAMYIGTRDPYYPLALVRRTRDLLAANGFPVHYVEFADQDHSYAPIADRLQHDAWAFLSGYRLSH